MTTLVNPALKQAPVRAGSVPAGRKKAATLLLFSLGEQLYGLPLRTVQEIVPMALLAQPPGLPPLLAGFLNLAGTLVPVLRLDRLFEVPPLTPGKYTPLLIVRRPDHPLALMVEKVQRILAVPEEAIVPVREHQSFNDCVVGLATVDERVLLVLSVERILLDKEQQCLADWQDREQARLRAIEASAP
jgi:purine-binding chemotaxis protein CheW